MIPEFLKRFLEGLSSSEKDEVWRWADSDPDVVGEIIHVVGNPWGSIPEIVITRGW